MCRAQGRKPEGLRLPSLSQKQPSDQRSQRTSLRKHFSRDIGVSQSKKSRLCAEGRASTLEMCYGSVPGLLAIRQARKPCVAGVKRRDQQKQRSERVGGVGRKR